MKAFTMRKRASAMALGIALATGAVVTTGALGTATPAYAQKSPYSKKFREAYTPVDEVVKAGGYDINAIKPQLESLVAMAANPDEKLAAGGLMYNAGLGASNQTVQLAGMEAMLESGKVAPETAPRYNFIAFQLSTQLKQSAKARTYLQRAIDLNYTSENVTGTNLKLLMAEAYFDDNMFREGLGVLRQAIDDTKAAAQPVDERWVRRGVAIGVTNKVTPEVYDYASMWVTDFPSQASWRDAINLTRNLNAGNFQAPEMLDLLRLSDKVGTLENKQDVIYYVEAADARRLPLEVKNVIEAAIAADAAVADDMYLSDQLQIAKQRIPDDRPSLPELAAEAQAATTDTKIVMAAGDTFYSYGDYVKAEQFYAKALNMPNVEKQVALTRLGIAQVELGKFAEAQATFDKVEGVRAPIANLWGAYAARQAAGG